jgi:chromosome segregation ATPase
MKYILLVILALSLLEFSCGSAGKHQSALAQRQLVDRSETETQEARDSLKKLHAELNQLKLQLEKTENVLIEFYLKYESSLPLNESTQKIREWQSEIKSLVSENTKLKEDLKWHQTKLNQLSSDLNTSNAKLSTNSADSLLHELEKSNASIDKLEATLAEKNNYLIKIINEIAELKTFQANFDQIRENYNQRSDSLLNQLDLALRRNAELSNELEKITNEKNTANSQKLENTRRENSKLKKELDEATLNLKHFKSENKNLQERIKSTEDKLNSLQNVKSEKQTESHKASTRQNEESLIKKINENEQLISKLETNVNSKEQTIAMLNDSMRNQEAVVFQQKSDYHKVKRELDSITSNYSLIEPSLLANLRSDANKENSKESNYLAQIANLETEKISLVERLKMLNSEIDKLKLENQNFSKELNFKNLQREQQTTENLILNHKLQDSIQMLAKESQKLKHIVTNLESEIQRNIQKINDTERTSDSLKNVIKSLQRTKLESNNVQSTESHQKKSIADKTTPDNLTPIAKQEDTVSRNTNKLPILKNLPQSIIDKCSEFVNDFKGKGITGFLDQKSYLIFIPQNYLFPDDRIAITQAGSELIIQLSTRLKSNQNFKLQIKGYGGNQYPISSDRDIHTKRANTILRLMNISGIQSSIMQIDTDVKSNYLNPHIPVTGIELKIYAE